VSCCAFDKTRGARPPRVMACVRCGGEYKLLATFIVLVAVLMLRPYGLFGTHEIERL